MIIILGCLYLSPFVSIHLFVRESSIFALAVFFFLDEHFLSPDNERRDTSVLLPLLLLELLEIEQFPFCLSSSSSLLNNRSTTHSPTSESRVSLDEKCPCIFEPFSRRFENMIL